METIASFLRDKSLLIAGATGFLGRPLIEKILRRIPEVRQLYLLIRPKPQGHGTLSAADRFTQEVLGSDVFDRLRRERGEQFEAFVRGKVTPLSGDITQDRLGLDPDTYARLTNEIQVVINSAALVVFDEQVDLALALNTLGPQTLLKFARDCNNAVFVHVSTAYVCGSRPGPVSEEVLGQPRPGWRHQGPVAPFDLEVEIEAMQAASRALRRRAQSPEMTERFRRMASRNRRDGAAADEQSIREGLNAEREKWLREELIREGMRRAKAYGWNDTYTLTKAMGEQLIVAHRGEVPTVILRPSIIESSLVEPEPGWLNGFRMADPIIVAYGKGRLTDFPANPHTVMDLIPVDYVVNALLATLPKAHAEGGLAVYHVATGDVNPLPFQRLYEATRDYFLQRPMLDKHGQPIKVGEWSFCSRRMFRFKNWLRVRLPVGLALWILEQVPWKSKRKHRLSLILKELDRLDYYSDIYWPYTNLSFIFDTKHTRELFASLTPQDQVDFNFDPTTIDWRHYIQEVHIPGIQRHVLKLEARRAGNGRRAVPLPEDGDPAEVQRVEAEATAT